MRNTLHEVLALDSIYRLLSLDERITIHRRIKGLPDELSLRTEKVIFWVSDNNWRASSIRYGDDRLLYYWDERTGWNPIEKYQKNNKKITTELKKIKL
ncbi:hypothetical protein [Riemerella columbipharyngis]|uniref:Uncharacterized protein n=1 Tax=Riemerella columbipharyngis TaxID=1071918 RepID=A0A1G7FBX0_9FLAO|nr:hypothetical protein [Riemerella columbipharyngis]SDE73387.1 hypothetical protein SAMN05421544_12129 [Riemerella columbipharyngis]